MSDKLENTEGILKDDEAYEELMSLFEEKTYWQRFKMMLAGLAKKHDTKEYKLARIELQRQKAPILAVLIPAILLVLLVIFGKKKDSDENVVELQIVEEAVETEKLDEPEPEPEPLPDEFVQTDVDFVSQVVTENVTTPTPDVPFSAQPQTFDTVLTVKSPVILKGIFGAMRDAGSRGQALTRGGGNQETEAAVMRSLRWLKSVQNDDGSWPHNRVAMTGLAILTFLAHGEKADSPEFGESIQRGLDFLLSRQNANGLFDKNVDGNNYSHPIATYALCEAYGMMMNPNLKEAADKALAIIIAGQHPSGGWTYKMEANSTRDDTSYMGWCAQALHAADMAGVYHDAEALQKACKLSVQGFKKNGFADGGFGYTSPQRGGLTGVGVLCLQFHGAGKDEYVRNSLANIIDKWDPLWVGSRPDKVENVTVKELKSGEVVDGSCPQYYYYYATQCMFQDGGERWKNWNKVMWPSYVNAQFRTSKGVNGSTCKCGQSLCKKLNTAYVDHEGEQQEIGHWVNKDQHGDRPVMDTCLAALQLMVYYRYLPSFKKVDVPEEVMSKPVDSGDIEVQTNL